MKKESSCQVCTQILNFHCLFCLAATGGVKWPPVDTRYISFISNDLGT